MGGGAPANTTTEQKLPEWADEYYQKDVMPWIMSKYGPDADDSYAKLKGPLMGSTSRAPLYNLGAGQLAGRAMQDNPYAPQSRQLFGANVAGARQGLGTMGAEASGAYLHGNPYMQRALARATGDIQGAFREGVAGLGSQYASTGNRGSSANIEAFGRAAQESLADPLTELYGQTYMQNYEAERARQADAARGLAGTAQGLYGAGAGLRELEFMDDQALMELGLGQQEIADINEQRRFKNQLAAFEWDQGKTQRMIAPVSQMIRGQGTTTSTLPTAFQQNPIGAVGQGAAGLGNLASGIGSLYS